MIRSIPLSFLIFLDDEEYSVTGSYFPGDPGKTSGPPEWCYPPEDPEFTPDSITQNGVEVDIPEEKLDEFLYACDQAADEAYELLIEKDQAEAEAFRDD